MKVFVKNGCYWFRETDSPAADQSAAKAMYEAQQDSSLAPQPYQAAEPEMISEQLDTQLREEDEDAGDNNESVS